MRRAILTIAILALVWIGYIAWPIYDLLVLIRAVETRDIGTVTRQVYFDRVRISLTNQIIDAYTRRTGLQISPFARSFASAGLAIADPVVQKLISPEALSQLLSVGWPVTAVPDAPPPGTLGITTNTIGTLWQILGMLGMALAGSKWTGRLSYQPTNASVLSSGFCSGGGGSSPSSFRNTFRTCLRTNSPKPYANKFIADITMTVLLLKHARRLAAPPDTGMKTTTTCLRTASWLGASSSPTPGP
jgi:Protein of unknown function (DUF2939)